MRSVHHVKKDVHKHEHAERKRFTYINQNILTWPIDQLNIVVPLTGSAGKWRCNRQREGVDATEMLPEQEVDSDSSVSLMQRRGVN